MSKRKNKPFTLIEVLLVLSVIAVVLGSIGISIPRALQKERFEKGVILVQEKLQNAVDIMLDYDTDLFVLFQESDAGVTCVYRTAKPLPEKALQTLKRNSFIPNIQSVRFEEGPLYFSASSSTIPQGIVTVVGEKNVEITCPGYPARMQKGRNEIKKIKAEYPKEAFPSS